MADRLKTMGTDVLSTELKALRDIQRETLKRPQDLDAVLGLILRWAAQLTEFHSGWLLLAEGDSLVIRAATNRRDLGRVLDVEDSVSGIAAQEGWTTVITRTPLGRAAFAHARDEGDLEIYPRVKNPRFASEASTKVLEWSEKKRKQSIENREKLIKKAVDVRE